MNQHTPGPWKEWDRIAGYGGVLITDDSGMVGVCRAIQNQSTTSEVTPDTVKLDADVCRANARLIAAAPDLLAACVEAMRITEHVSNLNYMVCTASLRAAIAKAKGGAA